MLPQTGLSSSLPHVAPIDYLSSPPQSFASPDGVLLDPFYYPPSNPNQSQNSQSQSPPIPPQNGQSSSYFQPLGLSPYNNNQITPISQPPPPTTTDTQTQQASQQQTPTQNQPQAEVQQQPQQQLTPINSSSLTPVTTSVAPVTITTTPLSPSSSSPSAPPLTSVGTTSTSTLPSSLSPTPTINQLNSLLTVPTPPPNRNPPASERNDANANLYIRNLPSFWTVRDLTDFYNNFGGGVCSACVLTDPSTKKSKCVGFIRFATTTQAQEAVDATNGVIVQGGGPLVARLAHIKSREEKTHEKQIKKLQFEHMTTGSVPDHLPSQLLEQVQRPIAHLKQTLTLDQPGGALLEMPYPAHGHPPPPHIHPGPAHLDHIPPPSPYDHYPQPLPPHHHHHHHHHNNNNNNNNNHHQRYYTNIPSQSYPSGGHYSHGPGFPYHAPNNHHGPHHHHNNNSHHHYHPHQGNNSRNQHHGSSSSKSQSPSNQQLSSQQRTTQHRLFRSIGESGLPAPSVNVVCLHNVSSAITQVLLTTALSYGAVKSIHLKSGTQHKLPLGRYEKKGGGGGGGGGGKSNQNQSRNSNDNNNNNNNTSSIDMIPTTLTSLTPILPTLSSTAAAAAVAAAAITTATATGKSTSTGTSNNSGSNNNNNNTLMTVYIIFFDFNPAFQMAINFDNATTNYSSGPLFTDMTIESSIPTDSVIIYTYEPSVMANPTNHTDNQNLSTVTTNQNNNNSSTNSNISSAPSNAPTTTTFTSSNKNNSNNNSRNRHHHHHHNNNNNNSNSSNNSNNSNNNFNNNNKSSSK